MEELMKNLLKDEDVKEIREMAVDGICELIDYTLSKGFTEFEGQKKEKFLNEVTVFDFMIEIVNEFLRITLNIFTEEEQNMSLQDFIDHHK